MSYKNYLAIIDDEYRDLGPHGAEPRNSIGEIPQPLVGKCVKVVNGKIVLDEVAQSTREAKEAADEFQF